MQEQSRCDGGTEGLLVIKRCFRAEDTNADDSGHAGHWCTRNRFDPDPLFEQGRDEERPEPCRLQAHTYSLKVDYYSDFF